METCPKECPVAVTMDGCSVCSCLDSSHASSSWFCSDQGCKWGDYIRGTDWDYYNSYNGDIGECTECQRLCTEDQNCWAVECGSGYCSWWANGVCDESSADQNSYTCRHRSPGTTGPSSCPSECVDTWVGDGVCNNEPCYFCTQFWNANNEFDGGDCDDIDRFNDACDEETRQDAEMWRNLVDSMSKSMNHRRSLKTVSDVVEALTKMMNDGEVLNMEY